MLAMSLLIISLLIMSSSAGGNLDTSVGVNGLSDLKLSIISLRLLKPITSKLGITIASLTFSIGRTIPL